MQSLQCYYALSSIFWRPSSRARPAGTRLLGPPNKVYAALPHLSEREVVEQDESLQAVGGCQGLQGVLVLPRWGLWWVPGLIFYLKKFKKVPFHKFIWNFTSIWNSRVCMYVKSFL